jgi:hypothetical protein
VTDKIVRRLRAYENEIGPVSLRGLRDDAAREIVSLRVIVIGVCGRALAAVTVALDWCAIVDMQIVIRRRRLQSGCNSRFVAHKSLMETWPRG